MRVPGITHIAMFDANLLSNIELEAAAGISPNLSNVSMTEIPFIGEPVCEVEDSTENNGTNTSVSLSFIMPFKIKQLQGKAFVVTRATGEVFLIGSRECVPAISIKDTAAGAGTPNACSVTVKLQAFWPWVALENVLPVTTGNTCGYEYWRVVTEAEIDAFINNLN